MKHLILTIWVVTFFTFNLISQNITHPNELLDFTPKGVTEPDTSITSTNSKDEETDGFRTEMKAENTGIKEADKTYRNLGFKHSVSKYLNENDSKNLSHDKLHRIANSFRLNSQPKEAEYWYSQFITENSDSKDILHYAQVLQSNGKCEDATRWYQRFKKTASRKQKKNREIIVDCEDLKNIKDHTNVKLKNVRALNTGHLDFSPIPYRDGVIFSTTRKNSKPKEVIDSWTDDNFSDLFYSAYDTELKRFKKPIPLEGDLNKQYHDGAATFDQSGSVMFFTRNNNNGKDNSKEGLIDLKIYSSNFDGEYWTNVTELPFNSDEFTSCHPTLAPDGKRLYFASNRPGGYGGLDIYVAESHGGKWGEPKNLGPTVNSAGNELFPVMHEDETLYYSSNGHRGLGGLDIFKANKTIEDDESSWSIRENLGTPFNSLRDDFGFVLINDGTHTGFLTSNRDGGKGKDDIYTWKMEGVEDDGIISRTICVYDEKTGARLSNASVTIMEKTVMGQEDENEDLMLTIQPLDDKEDKYILGITGKDKKKKSKVMNYETDTEGVFKYTAAPGKRYEMIVERDGYTEQKKEITYAELKADNEYCVPLTKRSCLMMSGVVINKKYDKAMPMSTVEVWNKCTNEKNKFTTDETGTFEMCVPCGCEYRVFATKTGFDSDTEFLSTIDLSCDSDQTVTTKLELGVRKVEVKPYVEPVAVKPVPTVPVTTYEEVVTYVPQTRIVPRTTYVPATEAHLYNTKPNTGYNTGYVNPNSNVNITDIVGGNTNLNVGQVINLKNVFYNFDKYDIREDASIDLNHVLNMMNKYPSLEIELMSHTDSRGNNEYNNRLSSNRAKSARQFLINKGVAGHRITAKGYGESQLKNQCADDVECSDEEHQQNRRTEIKVTKFNSTGTTITPH